MYSVVLTLYCAGTHSSTHPQVPKEKCEECKRIALDVIRVLKPTGPGGFDFLFQVGRCRKARLAHLSVPCMFLEARPRRDRPLGLTSLTTPSCQGCAPYRTGCRTSRTSTAAASTAGACEPASPSTPEREASPRSYLSATPGSARRTALCCAAWEPERFGPVPCGPLSLGRRLVLVGHALPQGTRWCSRHA